MEKDLGLRLKKDLKYWGTLTAGVFPWLGTSRSFVNKREDVLTKRDLWYNYEHVWQWCGRLDDAEDTHSTGL